MNRALPLTLYILGKDDEKKEKGAVMFLYCNLELISLCTTCPARIITTARTKTKVRGEIASGLSVSGEEMMEGCVCVCTVCVCV